MVERGTACGYQHGVWQVHRERMQGGWLAPAFTRLGVDQASGSLGRYLDESRVTNNPRALDDTALSSRRKEWLNLPHSERPDQENRRTRM